MSKAGIAQPIGNAVACGVLGMIWYLIGALASETLRGFLESASISAFAFLLGRFSAFCAVGYLGAQLIQWRGLRVAGPALVVGLLMAAERLTYHYEIYRFSMLSVLNLSIDFIGFSAGVLISWQLNRGRVRQVEGNAPAP